MKKNTLESYVILSTLIFALFFSGCLSISSSPASRFYTLHTLSKDEAVEKSEFSSSIVIGIGPVKIPDYLNRPQIVTRDKSQMLKFAEFDRWGEGLSAGILRLINENLSAMLPQASIERFPWNLLLPVKYQVIVDVIQLECRLDEDVYLLVQWSMLDLVDKHMVMTRRSEFRQPIRQKNYEGLADALSSACAGLSREIAAELAIVAGKEEKE